MVHLKARSIVLICALICTVCVWSSRSGAFPLDRDTNELGDELRKDVLAEELNEYERLLDKQLLEIKNNRRLNKRSDIDARLLELQAKILLTKAFANMPVGHGKFNFDKIGKRSYDTMADLSRDK